MARALLTSPKGRAQKLLRSLLTPAQKRTWGDGEKEMPDFLTYHNPLARGFMAVTGPETGHTYLLTKHHVFSVEHHCKKPNCRQGSVLKTWCIVEGQRLRGFYLQLPWEDLIIAKLLLIRCNETKFRKIAIPSRVYDYGNPQHWAFVILQKFSK